MSRLIQLYSASKASTYVLKHQKGATKLLYKILADCLEMVELCVDPKEAAALDLLIKELPLKGSAKRAYVEAGSDLFTKVCRLMLQDEECRANISRYVCALRQAQAEGVRSETLTVVLENKGGINRLFLQRPNTNKTVSTKCLRLRTAITHEKDETVTLVLRRQADNYYAVESCLPGPTAQASV